MNHISSFSAEENCTEVPIQLGNTERSSHPLPRFFALIASLCIGLFPAFSNLKTEGTEHGSTFDKHGGLV